PRLQRIARREQRQREQYCAAHASDDGTPSWASKSSKYSHLHTMARGNICGVHCSSPISIIAFPYIRNCDAHDQSDMKPSTDVDDKRFHKRVLGPLVGGRGALLPVPIRIHDLSAGGALIECFHEEAVGRRITIEIELPFEGWVTLNAEIVSLRPN